MAAKEIWRETKITLVMLKNLFKKLISFNKEQIQQAINQFS
jgi:hypothetical protein